MLEYVSLADLPHVAHVGLRASTPWSQSSMEVTRYILAGAHVTHLAIWNHMSRLSGPRTEPEPPAHLNEHVSEWIADEWLI